jgi:S1-C subfamily serine protease
MNKKIITSIFIIVGIFSAGFASSGKIALNPIKPIANKSPITDEQQAILAVRKAKVSVVNILGESPVAVKSNDSPLSVNLPPSSVAGTGFVLDGQGIIVTNDHVVENDKLNYFVVLPDGTRYSAKILGRDKFDDIALLKIETNGLVPASLGDSSSLETGQSVFAIGNSLGIYESTVTRGVVSGLGRSVDELRGLGLPTLHNWIQTDAAINPGNSGGPLINLNGEVVGMNTLIDISGSSLGFAVPVNTIKDSLEQLKNFGTVSRPYLGLQFITLNESLKNSRGLSVSQGALILSVGIGSPAANGGLLSGDIVISVDGIQLNSKNTLDSVIQKHQAGSQVILKALRGKEVLDKIIILGQFK